MHSTTFNPNRSPRRGRRKSSRRWSHVVCGVTYGGRGHGEAFGWLVTLGNLLRETTMQEFKPSRTRYLLRFWLATGLGAAFSYALIHFFLDPTPQLPAIFWAGGWFLGMLLSIPLIHPLIVNQTEHLRIVIADDTISGPDHRGRKRITFPLTNVDKNKCGKQTLLQKLLDYGYIYSTDGERISLSPFIFGKTKTDAILNHPDRL
jgi:hypothetical protein